MTRFSGPVQIRGNQDAHSFQLDLEELEGQEDLDHLAAEEDQAAMAEQEGATTTCRATPRAKGACLSRSRSR